MSETHMCTGKATTQPMQPLRRQGQCNEMSGHEAQSANTQLLWALIKTAWANEDPLYNVQGDCHWRHAAASLGWTSTSLIYTNASEAIENREVYAKQTWGSVAEAQVTRDTPRPQSAIN
eukprot:CAMPEP_0198598128 /NCGR_PEP_ID=MMETSP1462-20131121/145273_1 /TAXON_ID=1333877 /ORGANISM="Brandtodinium nutriculum, Strain RCC3387" /LENGTH=118 /DNA_ID=CAMNT_0044329787 /DNA_START=281 /DNA_END=635 /DNA_ORIENTATION=-